MYKDATIFLTRKKDIYDNFKDHYNLNENQGNTEVTN